MAYTEAQTIDAIKNAMAGGFNYLYNAQCLNWIGKTSDTKKPYTEVIANELINSGYVTGLKGLKSISRASYSSPNHRIIKINIDSNRKEENIAKVLYILFSDKSGRKLGELGNIFDYQVPLNKVRTNRAGKIDLVSYNPGSPKVWLIELKNEGNKETLLRCMLEIATYYQILDRTQFVKNYALLKSADANWIHKAVLVFEDSDLSNDLEDMKNGNRPKLQELSDLLGIEFFILRMNNQVTQIGGMDVHVIESFEATLRSNMNGEDKKREILQELNSILGDYNFIPSDKLGECRRKLVIFGMPPFYNEKNRDSFCMREMCAHLERCPITDDVYIFTDEWHDWIPMEFRHCIERAINMGKSIKYYYWDGKRFIQKSLVIRD